MRFQSFLDKVGGLPAEPAAYLAYLAVPEPGDGGALNVELIPAVKVEWDESSQSLRLYPELTGANDDTLQTLADLIDNLPFGRDIPPDARLQVQIPIVRSAEDATPTSFVEVHDIVVGSNSKEFWLLLKPRDEYPQSELPA